MRSATRSRSSQWSSTGRRCDPRTSSTRSLRPETHAPQPRVDDAVLAREGSGTTLGGARRGVLAAVAAALGDALPAGLGFQGALFAAVAAALAVALLGAGGADLGRCRV